MGWGREQPERSRGRARLPAVPKVAPSKLKARTQRSGGDAGSPRFPFTPLAQGLSTPQRVHEPTCRSSRDERYVRGDKKEAGPEEHPMGQPFQSGRKVWTSRLANFKPARARAGLFRRSSRATERRLFKQTARSAELRRSAYWFRLWSAATRVLGDGALRQRWLHEVVAVVAAVQRVL
jgi:hypothetical protein